MTVTEEQQTRRALEALDLAAGVVCDVRDDPDSLQRTLESLDRDQLVALAVVLAAQVPPDKTQAELVAWLVPYSRADWRGKDDEQVRAAHATYTRLRTQQRAGKAVVIPSEIREGEREYQARRKRLINARRSR